MNLKFPLAMFCGIILAAIAWGADKAPDVPGTQPALFSLHGKVIASPGIDLGKIDNTRTVVYLESDPILDAAPIPTEPAIVAQQNKEFHPNFVVIARGVNVEFPNWDHILHNVFSRSAAAPAFDLDRYPYGESKNRKFDKVGVVQVFCNIHPSMKALILVTPNPYFVRCDADGNFELKNVPAGHYQLTVWQERCGTRHQDVEVGPGLDRDILFTLQEDRDSILQNDPPRHGDGYGVDRGLGVKREKLNLPVVQDVHPAPTTEPCPNCN